MTQKSIVNFSDKIFSKSCPEKFYGLTYDIIRHIASFMNNITYCRFMRTSKMINIALNDNMLLARQITNINPTQDVHIYRLREKFVKINLIMRIGFVYWNRKDLQDNFPINENEIIDYRNDQNIVHYNIDQKIDLLMKYMGLLYPKTDLIQREKDELYNSVMRTNFKYINIVMRLFPELYNLCEHASFEDIFCMILAIRKIIVVDQGALITRCKNILCNYEKHTLSTLKFCASYINNTDFSLSYTDWTVCLHGIRTTKYRMYFLNYLFSGDANGKCIRWFLSNMTNDKLNTKYNIPNTWYEEVLSQFFTSALLDTIGNHISELRCIKRLHIVQQQRLITILAKRNFTKDNIPYIKRIEHLCITKLLTGQSKNFIHDPTYVLKN